MVHLDLNASEKQVREILAQLELTQSLTSGSTCYLIGDKVGGDPKVFSPEQAQNFFDSGDYTEEYLEDSFADFDNVIQWVEQTRND